MGTTLTEDSSVCYTDSDEHTHDVASFRHQTIIIQGVLLLEYVYIHVSVYINVCMYIHVWQYCYLHDSILSIVMDLCIYTCTCDCLGCAVLLCLVCLFDLACFFLSSFSSLI